jgi:hypothetical protein
MKVLRNIFGLVGLLALLRTEQDSEKNVKMKRQEVLGRSRENMNITRFAGLSVRATRKRDLLFLS